MRHCLFVFLAGILWSSCTEQRDLYVSSSPMLLVKNDWKPSRTNLERSEVYDLEDYTDPKATLMVYPLSNPIYCMEDHKRKTIALDQGDYSILVFNDYMYSESQTFLRNIRYRGTRAFDTFEAYTTLAGNRFKAKEGEVIVNNPDTLSTRSTMDLSIEGMKTFHLKYKNGKNGFPTSANYVEDSLLFTPCRVVHKCAVSVHVLNVKALNGVGKARASLRGFSGSVFLANRLPGHDNVTHQFSLNSLKLDPESTSDGTISAKFSTFGPPLDLPDRRYELEINVLYPSGREAPPFLFDITDQLTAQVARMNVDRLANKPIMDDIVIHVEITLDSDKGDWDVGLGDWGDDIIITVPVGV